MLSTCQIAALYTYWCRMRKGRIRHQYVTNISTAPFQRKPLPDSDISPSQTTVVTWQPVIPNGVNPLVPSGNLWVPK
jgi:hypothetical protein